ncbi:MAG TPA: CD1871A family CXXC motif-containing protein [Clostridia bacterium]|nr:CD1871A family CXXC motif-containing protein [Clostridia bacterium]
MTARKYLTFILIAIAVAMVVYGIFRSEVLDVFNKAIRICLECIGIGWLPW